MLNRVSVYLAPSASANRQLAYLGGIWHHKKIDPKDFLSHRKKNPKISVMRVHLLQSMMAPLFAAPCAAARINEENKSKGVNMSNIRAHGGDVVLSALHDRVSCFTTGGRTTKVKYKGSIQTSDPPHTLITYLNICWLSSILASSVIF